jgi:hypothetical protein
VSLAYLFPHVKPDGYWSRTCTPHLWTSLHDRELCQDWKDREHVLTVDEAQYLAAYIRYCNLFKGANWDSITCIQKEVKRDKPEPRLLGVVNYFT